MKSDDLLREALGGLRRDAKRGYRTKDPSLLIRIGMAPAPADEDESMPDDMDDEDDESME